MRKLACRRNEEGVTLVEMLVVLTILLILGAIAIPIYLNQQRLGIESTLQSDVTSTMANVSSWRGGQEYGQKLDQPTFQSLVVSSDPANIITLVMYYQDDPDEIQFCVQGQRSFGPGDIVTYHINDAVNGSLTEGACVRAEILPDENLS